jgi:hypothetical protein
MVERRTRGRRWRKRTIKGKLREENDKNEMRERERERE